MQGAIKGGRPKYLEKLSKWGLYEKKHLLNFVYAPTFENLNEGPAYTLYYTEHQRRNKIDYQIKF